MEFWKIVIFLCAVKAIFITVSALPLYYDNDIHERRFASKDYIEPTEVQNAMCNIVTDQIKATANATITRQLRGVCHAKEVREQIKHLETLLLREINKVHRIVQNLANHQNTRKSVVFKYLPNRP